MENTIRHRAIRASIRVVAALALTGPMLFHEPLTSAARLNGSPSGSGNHSAGHVSSTASSVAGPARVQSGGSFRSILARVPRKVRTDFLASLMFKNGKLATAHVGGIKAHLSSTQYKQLFGFLGEHLEPGDYDGYACDGVATCVKTEKSICISRNCTVGGPRGSSLGVMLARASEPDRISFLESLDFADGRVIRAYVGGIRNRLSSVEFQRLIGSLGVDGNSSRVRADYYRP